VSVPIPKNKDTWCCLLADYDPKGVSILILPIWQKKDGGQDDERHIGSVFVNPNDGNRCSPYLYENDANRKLNLNDRDNDWNANYRFAAVRLPAQAGKAPGNPQPPV
jgi:hypothetical protein